MAGPASGLPMGSQCTTGFFPPSRSTRVCTDQLSRSLVIFSIAPPTGLSGMRTLNRLPLAARFASGKVAANVVDWAATVEEEVAFEGGEASSATVPATKPAATAVAARTAAMTVHLGWCMVTIGRPLLIRAKLIGCVSIPTSVLGGLGSSPNPRSTTTTSPQAQHSKHSTSGNPSASRSLARKRRLAGHRHLGQVGPLLWLVALSIISRFIRGLHPVGRERSCRSRAGWAIAGEIGNVAVAPLGKSGAAELPHL